MRRLPRATSIVALLLLLSGFLNFVQYANARTSESKLALFEKYYGSYETLATSLEEADAASLRREHTLTIYFKAGTPESQILTLKGIAASEMGVQSVKYVSAAQALADFKTKHQDDPSTLEALQELGPAALGANLIITFSDPSTKKAVVDMLRSRDASSTIERIIS